MLDRSVDEGVNGAEDDAPNLRDGEQDAEADGICYFCGVDMAAGEPHDFTCRRYVPDADPKS